MAMRKRKPDDASEALRAAAATETTRTSEVRVVVHGAAGENPSGAVECNRGQSNAVDGDWETGEGWADGIGAKLVDGEGERRGTGERGELRRHTLATLGEGGL